MSKSIEGVQFLVKILVNINRDPELYNDLAGLDNRRDIAGRIRVLSNIGLDRTSFPLKQYDKLMNIQNNSETTHIVPQDHKDITKIADEEKGLFDSFRNL